MRSVETEGATIDEAIAKALEVLRVERPRVAIEIIANATPGILGFGGKKAKVRATVRGSFDAATFDETAPSEVPEVRRQTSNPVPQETGSVGTPPPEHRAVAVLAEIIRHLGAACTIEPRHGPEPEVLTLVVRGDDCGLLIGRQGQTLDAIEYVLNRITGSDGVRVMLDAEGYRARREQSLEQMARRVAAKVRESGRAIVLEPLSPRDRRTVHLALQGDQGVVTQSRGDGRFRQVVVMPEVRGQDSSSSRTRRS